MKFPDTEKTVWDVAIALLNSPEGKKLKAIRNPQTAEDHLEMVRHIVSTTCDCIKTVTGHEPKIDREKVTREIVHLHITSKESKINKPKRPKVTWIEHYQQDIFEILVEDADE